MGLLNSSLQIGRSALIGYQGALQVVGSNITSAGSPDYTRLSPELASLQGRLAGNLQPGAGVALDGIQRNIDEALEGRIRSAMGSFESTATQRTALAQVEAVISDLGTSDVSARLVAFFSAFDEVQNRPEDRTTRELALSSGIQLADSLQELRARLAELAEDLDGQIGDVAISVDDLARRIAHLNTEITSTEAGRAGQATGLRDQRDGLLRELAELIDVSVREQSNGALNVYIGSEALVQGNVSRGLTVDRTSDGEVMRTSIRFADTNSEAAVRGGRLAGLIVSRDVHALGRIDSIDDLASAIIFEVNRIHADGQGLSGFTSLTGTRDLLATDVALDSASAGLGLSPVNGSFYITVLDDQTLTPVAHRIDVELGVGNAGTTLESLVAEINASVAGVSASITSDKRLSFEADAGFSFTFGYDGQEPRQDTSMVLTALGINSFFSGTNARDIAVNDLLIAQPGLVAGSSAFLTGDGTNAGRIAALGTAVSDRLGGISIADSFSSIAGSVAVDGAAAQDRAEVAEAVLSSLEMQRESISGVNLDEEAISLIKYERAFQGAARFISVVDELLNQLILLIR